MSKNKTCGSGEAFESCECDTAADDLRVPDSHAHSQHVAQLVAQEIPFLRRSSRRWHRNAADADDLVQDTIVRVLANAHLWEPGTNFRGWVVTIMRNQFLAGFAKSSRDVKLLARIALEQPLACGNTPYLRLTLRDLQGALSRLPATQRLAILLVGVEGLSYEGAAQTMGLSTDAVRAHLARARDRLRQAALSGKETYPCSSRRSSAFHVRASQSPTLPRAGATVPALDLSSEAPQPVHGTVPGSRLVPEPAPE